MSTEGIVWQSPLIDSGTGMTKTVKKEKKKENEGDLGKDTKKGKNTEKVQNGRVLSSPKKKEEERERKRTSPFFSTQEKMKKRTRE